MKIMKYILVLMIGLGIYSCKTEASKFTIENPVDQLQLSRVDSMPNLPKPFKIIDFNRLAKDYDKLVYGRCKTRQGAL